MNTGMVSCNSTTMRQMTEMSQQKKACCKYIHLWHCQEQKQ